MARDIHSAGIAVLQKFQMNTVRASTETQLAGMVAAATECVQRYAEYNRAQVALAALHLSGIKQAVIRPPESLSRGAEQDSYQVMAPPEDVAAAQAVLQNVHLSQLNFASAPSAVQAMQALKASGIQATVGFLRGPGGSKSSERLFAVFVGSADAGSTQPILGRVGDKVDF